MKKASESQIQRSILEYLSLRGYLVYRMNTGQANVGGRYIRFGSVGMADLLAMKDGRAIWIECKKPGGKQSDWQKAFQDAVTGHGCVYLLVSSLEQVQDWELHGALSQLDRQLR